MALTPSTTPPADDKKAKIKAAQDDALLREVDEAVRQDEFADFGKKYGRPLLAAVTLGLAGFGGWLWWDGRQEAALEADSEKLVSAMDQIDAGNLDTGTESLRELTGSSNAGARAAALLLQGGTLAQQGNLADAAKAFGDLAADDDAPQAYRDLALVRQVQAQYDAMTPDEVIARLGPLAVPDNAYFGAVGEMVAMAYLDQGKRGEAGALFSRIARNEDVPDSLRSRARQMAGVLGVDAIVDVDEVLEQVDAGTGTGATQVQGN